MSELTKEEIVNETAVSGEVNAMDAKFKRIVVALTVGAVVLLSLLIILMCYQMIKIGVERRRKADFNAKITELTEQLKNGEDELAYLRTKDAIERLAREYNYQYVGDQG